MIDEKEWRANFATSLGETRAHHPNRRHGAKGTHFDSRHRVPRMLRFAHRHGSPAMVGRLIRLQQSHEVARRDEKEAQRLAWSRALPVKGALKRRGHENPR